MTVPDDLPLGPGPGTLADNLAAIINHEHDQVLFVDVGPVEGRGSTSIRSLGKPYTHPERHALVV